jgi:hypothetical protein
MEQSQDEFLADQLVVAKTQRTFVIPLECLHHCSVSNLWRNDVGLSWKALLTLLKFDIYSKVKESLDPKKMSISLDSLPICESIIDEGIPANEHLSEISESQRWKVVGRSRNC